ncbi:hypothetical protein LXA43DRAFT_1064172 [Ganoderma leucocontextum]|nr:hypothetical protein LXA43DRAFT_1064172 [Ganoderma leucocontextum]
MACTKQTARQSTGGVAPRAKLDECAKRKRRMWTQCTQDAEDSDECTPTASAKRKTGLNTSMEETRDCEEYVTSISGKYIRLNSPRAARAKTTPEMPAIVEAEEQCASNDAGGVVDKPDGLYGQSSDGECLDGEISDGESSKADKPCVATALLQPLEPLIVTDLSNLRSARSQLKCLPSFISAVRLAAHITRRVKQVDGHPTDAYFPQWVSVVAHAARPQHIQYRARWDEILTALGHITNWWEQLIPSKVKQIATTPSNELTITLIACGAIVNNEWPRRELKAVATEYVIHVLDFTHCGDMFTLSVLALSICSALFFSRATLKNEFIVDVYDWMHLTM